MRHLLLGMAILAAGLWTAEPGRAWAEMDATLRAGGWQFYAIGDRAEAGFVAAAGGGIAVTANHAVGFLYRRLAPGQLAEGLAWRWRVDRMPPPTRLDQNRGDDRPLAVHVVFAAPGDQGFFEGLGRSLRGLYAGSLFAGRTVTYVWGGRHPVGARFANPYLSDDGVLIVLRSGTAALGNWVEERVDPRADYRDWFHQEPPAAVLIAVSSDTDDQGGIAAGNIRFVHPALNEGAQ